MSFTAAQNQSSPKSKSRSSHEAFDGETDEGEVKSSRSPRPPRVGVDERGAGDTARPSPPRATDVYKTKLCEFYPKCPDGRGCRFAHGAHELRKNALRYKTEMCHRVPHCRSGDRCNFAHSRDELRRAPSDEGGRRPPLRRVASRRRSRSPSSRGGRTHRRGRRRSRSSSTSLSATPQRSISPGRAQRRASDSYYNPEKAPRRSAATSRPADVDREDRRDVARDDKRDGERDGGRDDRRDGEREAAAKARMSFALGEKRRRAVAAPSRHGPAAEEGAKVAAVDRRVDEQLAGGANEVAPLNGIPLKFSDTIGDLKARLKAKEVEVDELKAKLGQMAAQLAAAEGEAMALKRRATNARADGALHVSRLRETTKRLLSEVEGHLKHIESAMND